MPDSMPVRLYVSRQLKPVMKIKPSLNVLSNVPEFSYACTNASSFDIQS